MNPDDMNQSPPSELRDALWRGSWSTGNQEALARWLAEHPEARADWEAELALQRSLNQLPPVPVSSNFTDRVLQALDREVAAATAAAAPRARWWRLPLLGRALAGTAALAVAGGFLVHQHRMGIRSELARSIAVATNAAQVPGVEALENFDAIDRLASATPVDEELFGTLTELASH